MNIKKTLAVIILATLFLYVFLLRWRDYIFSDERIVEKGTMLVMNEIQVELEKYKSMCQSYPNNLEELAASAESCPTFHPTKVAIIDGWQNSFQYARKGDTYSLSSMGHSWIEATPHTPPKVINGLR